MSKDNLRQNELNCLNLIKDNFFTRSKKANKVFDNSDFLKMAKILDGARHNENHNNFPDFFFDGGIIEHFEVTSSNETNKKGSEYRTEEASNKRKTDNYFKQCDEEFIKCPHKPNTMRTATVEETYECFSYDGFVKSFKRNSEKHLNSLSNSKYSKQVVVFLIEQQSAALNVYEHGRFNRFYKLSEDKKILQYIKKSFIDVDYIIFKVADMYEIIDLSKIDSVIADAKNELDIRPGRQTNTSLRVYVNY